MAGGRRKLSPRQERFVQEYLVDLNASQAALRAGYSKKNHMSIGAQLLMKTHIKEAIAERKRQLEARAWLTTEKVLADLEELRQRALADGDYRSATKASELHGKYLGMWTERVEQQVTHSGSVAVSMCRPEEAKRILEEALSDE